MPSHKKICNENENKQDKERRMENIYCIHLYFEEKLENEINGYEYEYEYLASGKANKKILLIHKTHSHTS